MTVYGQRQMAAMQKHRQKVAIIRTVIWFVVALVVITTLIIVK